MHGDTSFVGDAKHLPTAPQGGPSAPVPAPEAGRVRSPYERFVKPVFDRTVAAVLLLVLSPLFALVAVLVRYELGAGVLYRQERVGLDGRRIQMLKFRTMQSDRRRDATGVARPDRRAATDRRGSTDRRVSTAPYDGPERRVAERRQQERRQAPEGRRRTHKTPDDPRHTRLGRFLRRTSLDELPQLVNVMRGDLSMVGPRPELPEVVAVYAAWQHARHAVKPGITGLWQVTERDDGRPMQEHVATDLRYVASVSLVSDLLILALTVPAILGMVPTWAARWLARRGTQRGGAASAARMPSANR
ncbi:sugar transferase [Egicoccus halophilus]|uniref:Bacterial sugar transferase domain-containing protein n=1 Tax=Egicoccus halophilus TaxID=1670830 RepID=A0A8J3A792_9ACTN|nr:sugar transferase [Egicoccus halophilus]GGI05456.1 hypothetical protein GCM10011354_14190 [Egicoccus halophilus]